MPDGQEKSDDLIAELARLMASAAAAPEPDAKSGPKLVSGPGATVASSSGSGAVPVAEAARPASPAPVVEPARAAPVIRIPGMDQLVPSSRAAEPAPQTAPAIEMPAALRPSAIDFTPAPATTAAASERRPMFPATTVPVPAGTDAAHAEASKVAFPRVEVPNSTTYSPLSKPAHGATAEELPVARVRPQPAGDAFDFDFGLGGDTPQPETVSTSAPPRPMPESAPVATRQSSGDLIADLIAAELDMADLGESVPTAPFSPAPSRPEPSPVPSPMAMPRATPTSDSFVGMAATPARPAAPMPRPAPAPAIAVERDPIDEIESLIGEAVRVQLGNDRPVNPPANVPTSTPVPSVAPRVEPRASVPVPPPPAQSAPVVPPLTTGFAPRRAALKDNDVNISSAEAAIRAAAAAADSAVDVEAETPIKQRRAHRERHDLRAGGLRQYVGMAVAGTLLLAAGFGLYWVFGMGGGSDGEVPVLQADATPVKEAAPAAPAATDTQGSVVFSEIDGSSTAEGEQLVSRDDSTDTTIADVARTVGDNGEGVSESELANRKVRTVTVRPDGTIVSGEEAVAGNEALPVDRPSVPDLPGADVQPSELLATLPTNDAASPASDATAPTGAATATTDAAGALAVIDADAATPVSGEPVVQGSTVTTASGATAPIPMPAPNREALAGRVASAPVSAPVAVSAGSSGSYAQLSSQPSEAEALTALERMQSRVNGARLEVRRVDLGAKGVWYRVVQPTASFQEATQVCATIKSNGYDCLPING